MKGQLRQHLQVSEYQDFAATAIKLQFDKVRYDHHFTDVGQFIIGKEHPP